MAVPALMLSSIGLSFGGPALLDNADLQLIPGARMALVGRNGSGKSTLLKIAAGLIEPDRGERFVQPGTDIRYLLQEPDPAGYTRLADYVTASFSEERDRRAALILLEELGLSDAADPTALSGGEWRKVAIAQTLAGVPDIVLLDEPTNHLDLSTILWLEKKILSMNSALIVISHDRRFLENVTTQTLWLDRGKTRLLDRDFSVFEEWRDEILEAEQSALHKLGRKIASEEDWLRYGVTARRRRNMRRLGELKAMRKRLRDHNRAQGKVKFSISESDVSGKRVIRAENISKAFGEKKVVDGFSIEISRGDRIGVVGPNGAGKTTLINLLTTALSPDKGKVELGAGLEIISLDQRRESLIPEMTLADAIADGRGDWITIGGTKRHIASYLRDFLFAPEQWRTPVKALSGGERGRLALAAALAKPSNLLILDEPTNDLDLETLELLEELLSGYDGTLLLVSHDRSFLDHIVTSIIAPDPQKPGAWRRYAGGYDDMVAQRGAAPGVEAKTVKSPKRKLAQSNPTPTKSPEPKTKLSFKEKYALETLPGEIDALQEKARALKAILADPALFARDPKMFEKTAADLAEIEQKLSAAEHEWLRLEMKREALEGG